LSDDEFNKIMAITAKDGESSPLGIYIIEGALALNKQFNPCVLAKIPFSKKVFEGIPALSRYLKANPLSDKEFYEIMQIRTKDGGNSPFGLYLVDRYLNGKHDVSSIAMENVVKNSRIDKSGRFGMGQLNPLSKQPYLHSSDGKKTKDVVQLISEYLGNPRIMDKDLLARFKDIWPVLFLDKEQEVYKNMAVQPEEESKEVVIKNPIGNMDDVE
jgi:hypothetical protein